MIMITIDYASDSSLIELMIALKDFEESIQCEIFESQSLVRKTFVFLFWQNRVNSCELIDTISKTLYTESKKDGLDYQITFCKKNHLKFD